MMDYVIGIDLGATKLAVCLVKGPSTNPRMCYYHEDYQYGPIMRTCKDYMQAVHFIKFYKSFVATTAHIFAEDTFSAGTRDPRRQYLRMTGLNQEKTAGKLAVELAKLGYELERVKPLRRGEAHTAWLAFGRPTLKGKTLGEHLKDSLGVALCGLIHLEQQRRDEKIKESLLKMP